MLQIFRNNQLYVIPFVLLYLLLFFGHNFMLSSAVDLSVFQSQTGSFIYYFYDFIRQSKYAYWGVGFLLITIQALYVNALTNQFRLSKKAGFVTAISYILVLYTFAQTDIISPILIANTFFIAGLWSFYHCFDKKVSLTDVFNAGFWLGVACLCTWTMSMYMLVFAGIYLLFKNFDWREWVILWGGFFVPIFLMWTYQYVVKDAGASWWGQEVFAQYGLARLQTGFSLMDYVSLAGLALMLLLIFLNAGTMQQKTTIQEQRYINTAFILLVAGGALSFLVQAQFNLSNLSILALPLSILLSLFLQSLRKEGQAELFHLFLLMVCVAAQYQKIFFV